MWSVPRLPLPVPPRRSSERDDLIFRSLCKLRALLPDQLGQTLPEPRSTPLKPARQSA
jgi:hypothetical protein